MANVALSTIRHGKEDGTVIIIKEGDPVRGLPEEVVKELEELGVVGEVSDNRADVDDRDVEIANLRTELEKAKKASQTAPK